MGSKRKKISDTECSDEDDEFTGERGCTVHEESINAANTGNPLPLDWDPKRKVPIGKYAPKIATWIGVQARQHVPIDLEKFKLFDNTEHQQLKKKLIKGIKAAYHVPVDCEQYCFTKTAESWRSWKARVAKYYLYDKKTGEMKAKPPSKYPMITQKQWDNFKAIRSSESFKVLSDKNKANIAKKETIYYGSRGGYRLIEERLRKEMGPEGDKVDIDRHMTWLAGHTSRKARPMSEYDKDVASKIDALVKDCDEGKFIPKGREDILAKAINRPEHPGRVRGVSSHVGIAKVFGKTPKRQSDDSNKMIKLLAKVILKMDAGGKASNEELAMIRNIVAAGDEGDEKAQDKDAYEEDMSHAKGGENEEMIRENEGDKEKLVCEEVEPEETINNSPEITIPTLAKGEEIRNISFCVKRLHRLVQQL